MIEEIFRLTGREFDLFSGPWGSLSFFMVFVRIWILKGSKMPFRGALLRSGQRLEKYVS